MRIKTVNVELNKKATVNYHSFGNSVGLTADVDDGDDPMAVVRELQKKAAGLLIKVAAQKENQDGHATPVAAQLLGIVQPRG